MAELETFSERLRRLREDRGLSRSQLSRRTAVIDGEGIPEITIKVLETTRTRTPTTDTMQKLAAALEVQPVEFAEYQLALARRLFDERELGLDEALKNLSLLDDALERAGEAALADAAARAERRTPRSAPARRAARQKDSDRS